MARSLSRAIQLDSSLKDKAIGDLEFYKFKDKDSLKNALK